MKTVTICALVVALCSLGLSAYLAVEVDRLSHESTAHRNRLDQNEEARDAIRERVRSVEGSLAAAK